MQPIEIRSRPTAAGVERVQRAAAQNAGAAADQAPAPEATRTEDRVWPDIHVLFDGRRAMREHRAKADPETRSAGIERQPVEGAAEEHAGQPGHEREGLCP